MLLSASLSPDSETVNDLGYLSLVMRQAEISFDMKLESLYCVTQESRAYSTNPVLRELIPEEAVVFIRAIFSLLK